MKKDMQRLVKAAENAGWMVSRTKKNHLKFKAPTGATVIAASTPSDHRSVMNTRAELRRHGLDV